jgi:hypothetical protein
MEPGALHAWSKFFVDHPSEARLLAHKFKYLRRMHLLALIDPRDAWADSKMVCPQSEEETKMLKGGWSQAFLHAPLGQGHTYYSVGSKFRLFQYMDLTTAQKTEVSTMAKGLVSGYGSKTLKLRKAEFELKTNHVEESLRHVMSWIGHDDMREMIAKENARFLRLVIAERPEYWDEVEKLGDVYRLVVGTRTRVMAEVCSDPGLGQLAIGNPRFEDKSELVELWLKKYQYRQPHWKGGDRGYDGIFHPKEMAIDITELPDKFFTKSRINSVGRMLKVYTRLTLIASRHVVRGLSGFFPSKSFTAQRRAWTRHDYDQQQMVDSKEVVTNDAGDILQTNAGLH